METELKEKTCRICGCTDSKACEGGCSWVLPEICSKCVTETVPECIEALVAIIEELHKEIDDDNYGDLRSTTPDVIKTAKSIATAIRS